MEEGGDVNTDELESGRGMRTSKVHGAAVFRRPRLPAPFAAPPLPAPFAASHHVFCSCPMACHCGPKVRKSNINFAKLSKAPPSAAAASADVAGGAPDAASAEAAKKKRKRRKRPSMLGLMGRETKKGGKRVTPAPHITREAPRCCLPLDSSAPHPLGCRWLARVFLTSVPRLATPTPHRPAAQGVSPGRDARPGAVAAKVAAVDVQEPPPTQAARRGRQGNAGHGRHL